MCALDTHPDAEKVQIKLLKQASISERLRRTLTMSSWLLWLSKQAISKAHTMWTPREVDLFFVKVHYGKALAAKLQNYLKKNEL